MYNSTLAQVLALCNDHTHRTPGLPAHFINIKPEKQDKNAQIAPDACSVMKTEKCGPTFKAEFDLVAKQLKLISFFAFSESDLAINRQHYPEWLPGGWVANRTTRVLIRTGEG